MKNVGRLKQMRLRRCCIGLANAMLIGISIIIGSAFNGTIDASTIGITEVTRVIFNIESYSRKGRYDEAFDYIARVKRANKGNEALQSLLEAMSEQIETEKGGESE